jgi:WD repeat-containing protein 35
MMHKNHWYEEMINNRNKSVVTDMRWTPNGEKIGIVYEDGAIIVGSVEGNRLWGKELKQNLQFIEWSPDSRTILFGLPDGSVNIHDYVGNFLYTLEIHCNRGLPEDQCQLAAVEWYDHNKQGFSYVDFEQNAVCLCIAYSAGRIQLMRSETDKEPVLIDTGMLIKNVKWSPNGDLIAVCGAMLENSDGKGIVQFYSPSGQHLRTLKVPGTSGVVNALSWEGYGLRIALAVDSNILFANIQPCYLWSYFGQTLVFAFRKPERNDMCIIFWDTVINEKHIKYLKHLSGIAGVGDYCCLISKLETEVINQGGDAGKAVQEPTNEPD